MGSLVSKKESSSGGASSSEKTPVASSPSATFRASWRKIHWENMPVDLEYVKNYQPKNKKVKHLRVLLYGPVGAGKSTLINSVKSILRGRMDSSAATCASANFQKSFTKRYKTHRIEKDDKEEEEEEEEEEEYYPFVFNDIMGLENEMNGLQMGLQVEDLKMAIKGHVMENYEFREDVLLSEGSLGYNSQPSLDDKCHILVCVISANEAEITQNVLEKMHNIREYARDLDIPQLCIMTKIDEACGDTESDLTNVYKSKYIKKKMSDISSAVGFPMSAIFPVKNYSEEIELNDNVNALILSVMRRILNFGDDFIRKAQIGGEQGTV